MYLKACGIWDLHLRVCKHLKPFDVKFKKHFFANLLSLFWCTFYVKVYLYFFITNIVFYFSMFISKGEILNGLSCKRRQLFEDVNLLKKLKINKDKSGMFLIWSFFRHVCFPVFTASKVFNCDCGHNYIPIFDIAEYCG